MAEVKTKASHIKEANESLQYVPSESAMQPQKIKTTREELEERWRNGGMSYAEFEAAMNKLGITEFTKDKEYKEFDAMVEKELEKK